MAIYRSYGQGEKQVAGYDCVRIGDVGRNQDTLAYYAEWCQANILYVQRIFAFSCDGWVRDVLMGSQ